MGVLGISDDVAYDGILSSFTCSRLYQLDLLALQCLVRDHHDDDSATVTIVCQKCKSL